MSVSPLSKLLPSLGLLMLAFFLFRQNSIIASPDFSALFSVLPYVVASISLLLAAYYDRLKLFVMSLILLVVYWLIKTFLQTTLGGFEALSIYTLLSVNIPLLMVVLNVLPERGIYNYKGLLVILSFFAVVLFSYWLINDGSMFMHRLNERFPVKPAQGYILSIPASLGFAVSALIGVYFLCKFHSENAAASLSVLLFCFIMLALFDVAMISVAMISSAAISLILYLITSSYDMAYTDELTGLRSRRSLNMRLKSLPRCYVIAMLDIDRFKKLNDSYGHDVGDHVLKMVAKQIKAVKGGSAYRYGGEEFCVIFPRRSLDDCLLFLEAVRVGVENYSLSLRDLERRPKSLKQGKSRRGAPAEYSSISVTISIGAAQRDTHNTSPESVIKAADQALYQAKKRGRNRIVSG